MTELRDLFRENLKALREAKGFSQRDLSEECNYTRSYVGQLERGEKDPSFESLIRLAEGLDLSILDFFRNDRNTLEVQLTDALEEITNLSDNNIRSLTTMPEIMNWEMRIIWFLDPAGRILDFNRAAYEFIHEEKDDILGTRLWELEISEESRGHDRWLQDAMTAIQEDGVICRTNFLVDSPLTGEAEVEVTLFPINVVDETRNYVIVGAHRCEHLCTTESPRELVTAKRTD